MEIGSGGFSINFPGKKVKRVYTYAGTKILQCLNRNN